MTIRAQQTQDVKIGNESYPITSDDDYLNHVGSVFEPDMCKLFLNLIKIKGL